MNKLKSPFTYFGGKSKVAAMVWQRFGDVANYVEPFFGSGAVLLQRPNGNEYHKETVNDLDGLISNFWRAVANAPDDVARWSDWPQNENDLHARHLWLVNRAAEIELQPRLEADPDYCDAKIAGYWLWGMCLWIGSGWCSGNGPWHDVDGKLTKCSGDGMGINRKRLHLGRGTGINRQRLHLGRGTGINRTRLHLGSGGRGNGINADVDIYDYMNALSDRLRHVRVASGDWSRVTGKLVTYLHGLTAVFLDPPYADTAKRQSNLYRVDSESVAHDVREWAIENGHNPLMRIALCGYAHEHDMPDDWTEVNWNAGKGYAVQNKKLDNQNGKTETVWFSPHCIKPELQYQQETLI